MTVESLEELQQVAALLRSMAGSLNTAGAAVEKIILRELGDPEGECLHRGATPTGNGYIVCGACRKTVKIESDQAARPGGTNESQRT